MTAQVGELTSMLRAMKLNAMADELERQFTERSYKEMSFGDRMDLIVISKFLIKPPIHIETRYALRFSL